MKFMDLFYTERCSFCGTDLINEKTYIVRDETDSGVASALSSREPELHSAVNCPKCGLQKVLGKYYRPCEQKERKNDK